MSLTPQMSPQRRPGRGSLPPPSQGLRGRPLSPPPGYRASPPPATIPAPLHPHSQVRGGGERAYPAAILSPSPRKAFRRPAPQPGPARVCATHAPRGHSPRGRPAQFEAAQSVPPGEGRGGAGQGGLGEAGWLLDAPRDLSRCRAAPGCKSCVVRAQAHVGSRRWGTQRGVRSVVLVRCPGAAFPKLFLFLG